MRNGNRHLKSHFAAPFSLRSYPTYEEWKQNYKEEEVKEMTSSYPTYEEWKPGITRSEE